ncbi:MAG TPA: hemerythrin domain-containing protein [Usitatibacter sp.]|nr:hemerythrin domain-containing protein [Usitatibacter sp.]HUP09963.1 hemerythrin domain-containing protein [Caldimonas sp.]
MTDPTARWREEHARFAALLAAIERQLDRFHEGERPDYALLLEAMRYMNRYPDRCHHPQEDVAFEKIAAYEPKHASAVAELVNEHAQIQRAGEELVELLEETLDDAILTRQKVETPGRAYVRLLRDHMRREEQFFERAAQLLRPEDWAEIERAVPLEPDPLVATRPEERFTNLRIVLARSAVAVPLRR